MVAGGVWRLDVWLRFAGTVCVACLLAAPCLAQDETLPDAPSAVTGIGQEQGMVGTRAHPVVASNHAKFIFPRQTAPPLSPVDKVNMGLIHGISLYSSIGWVVASEYEHLIEGAPNYGTDAGAYGQRLGSSALRGYTEEVLGTSVLAPLLHEDPRFYRMATGHGIVLRTAYAVTRTVVTRTDAGGHTLNLSLLGGNLAGAALTNAYYPAQNRGFAQTFRTYGGSMGGAAFGFVVDEFLPDKILSRTMIAVHLRHR